MAGNKTSRVKRLEERATPDGGRVYAIQDSAGLYWVNDKAFTDKEFNAEFGTRENVIVRRVGFDLSRV